MKKKILGAVAALTASAMLLGACGGSSSASNAANSAASADQTSSVSDTSEPLRVGVWTEYKEIVTPVISAAEKAVFEKAMASYEGVELEPVVTVATQVIAGTNYVFLCRYKTVPANSDSGWLLAKVYEDLEKNAHVIKVSELDYEDIKTTEKINEADLDGGWKYADPSNAVTLPEPVWAAFNKAAESYTDGPVLSPLALIAQQLVSGMNYRILCVGTTAAAEPVSALYYVDLYVDTAGNPGITTVRAVDVLDYISLEEFDYKKEDDSSSLELPVLGGWTDYEKYDPSGLIDNEKELFEKVISSYDGLALVPVAVVAARSDANSYEKVFLCRYAKTPETAKSGWVFAKVTEDLHSEDKRISDTAEIDIRNVVTTEKSVEEDSEKNWLYDPVQEQKVLPRDLQSEFQEALQEFDGFSGLEPIAILGTQVVSGMNYRILCSGTADGQEPALYLAELYVDAEGAASFVSVKRVDLLGYFDAARGDSENEASAAESGSSSAETVNSTSSK